MVRLSRAAGSADEAAAFGDAAASGIASARGAIGKSAGSFEGECGGRERREKMNERRASSLSNVLVIFGTLLQFESGAKRALCAAFTLAFAFFETPQLINAAELTPNDVPPAIMREF